MLSGTEITVNSVGEFLGELICPHSIYPVALGQSGRVIIANNGTRDPVMFMYVLDNANAAVPVMRFERFTEQQTGVSCIISESLERWSITDSHEPVRL